MQADWLMQACGSEGAESAIEAGGFLFRLGDTPRDLYLVIEGEARARRYGTDGAEIVMQRSRAGELFAEAGLVAPRYSCEGYCPNASRVLRIPITTIKQQIASVPARIVWTRFCNSGRLFHGISLTGFEG
jgi:CRP-like cAMP-binding protein